MRYVRVECRRGGIPDAICPDRMTAEKNSECDMSGWNVGRKEFRMRYVRIECRRGGIPDVRCPGGMSAGEEFQMRYVRVECWWGGIPDVRCPGGMSDVMCRKGEGATW